MEQPVLRAQPVRDSNELLGRPGPIPFPGMAHQLLRVPHELAYRSKSWKRHNGRCGPRPYV